MYFDRSMIYFENQQLKDEKIAYFLTTFIQTACLLFREIYLFKTFMVQYENILSFQKIEILEAAR